jgi:hypothetical protein
MITSRAASHAPQLPGASLDIEQLRQRAACSVAQLLSRFRGAFTHADLQAIASQAMALLSRSRFLSTELTRILGTSRFPLDQGPSLP